MELSWKNGVDVFGRVGVLAGYRAAMTPWTPKRVADLLRLDDSDLARRPLREHSAEWEAGRGRNLGRDEIARICEWNIERGTVTAQQAENVLAAFDQATAKAREHGPFDEAPPAYELVANEGPVRREGDRLLRIAREGGSVLTDHDVWTDQNLEVIVDRFVNQPDVSGAGFFEKLTSQLDGVHDDVRILFAEIFLLQMLPIARFHPETKIRNIERVVRDVDADLEIPPEVVEALHNPVFGGGVAFATRRFHQLSLLIAFVRHIRLLSDGEWTDAREDPPSWRSVVADVPGTPEPALRAYLTYLGHPDYFFPIISEQHKEWIVESFFPGEAEQSVTGDLDADLATLRQWLSPDSGTTPDFYSDPLESVWAYEEEDGEEYAEEPADDAEYSVQTIAEEGAFHSTSFLSSIITRWRETKNVVLQGAPGTGKTWLARKLAYALIGRKDADAVRSVQFHPGSSYEDFVRGWRPTGDGVLGLVDGPLMQHAENARKYPDIEHVLIIEEFNRGNPVQTLGEMLTLMESTKRNDEDALELTYMHEGEAPFSLPENLYIIGTMNTADRSLALVDFALRRRFAFFDLEPQLNDAWEEYLADRFRAESRERISQVAARVRALNAEIFDAPDLGPSFAIGHSFFVPGKTVIEFVPWYRSVVETSVAPQLKEYWPEDPEVVTRLVRQLLEGV